MGKLKDQPNHDQQDYSESDHDLFRRLSNFSHGRRIFVEADAPLAGPRPFADPAEAWHYTDKDMRAFDDLTKVLNEARPVPSSRRLAGGSNSGAAHYTAGDDRLFSDLMVDHRYDESGHQTPLTVASAAYTSSEPTRYTKGDLLAFDRLTYGAGSSGVPAGQFVAKSKSIRDHGIGQIRIFDADKEREKVRRDTHSGGPNIKVKFFD